MTRSYAVVTPARDEADNLPRLAASLAGQTVLPAAWYVVENGSTDGTLALALGLEAEHEWIHVLSLPGATAVERGAPIVRALHAGLDAMTVTPDVVVNVDADVSFEPGYFERLLARFDEDPGLGIASGSAYELERGEWRQRHVTGSTVWGAARAYRWSCLQELLPLEERMAWDGLDEFRANARGWRTLAFVDLPFHHHRREGERDGSVWRAGMNQGRAAHYLGYRFWYLVLRAGWNARRSPGSLAMIPGYLTSAARREEQSADPTARAYLRGQQSLRNLRTRSREARGRRTTLPSAPK
jgi:biofilm PGA synthesis N-glycosyltransferase PgaC